MTEGQEGLSANNIEQETRKAYEKLDPMDQARAILATRFGVVEIDSITRYIDEPTDDLREITKTLDDYKLEIPEDDDEVEKMARDIVNEINKWRILLDEPSTSSPRHSSEFVRHAEGMKKTPQEQDRDEIIDVRRNLQDARRSNTPHYFMHTEDRMAILTELNLDPISTNKIITEKTFGGIKDMLKNLGFEE